MDFEDLEAEEEYFSKYKPQGNKIFSSRKATIILIIFLLFIIIYLSWSYRNWRKISLSKVSNDDTLSTVIAKFRLSISKVHDTVQILKFLRKKIHDDKKILMNAVESKIIRYIFECIQDLPHDDERVPAGLDVLNEIWAWNDAKAFLLKQAAQDEDTCAPDVPSYVDEMMQLIKQLQKSKLTSLEVDNEITKPSQSQPSSVLGSLFDSQPEVIDYSQYEYKLIMSLGLMSMDIPKIQSRVGDKGGIKFVIDAMESHKTDPKISKWGSWALVHLSFNHPPNKCEVIQRGGIPLTINVLTHFSSSRDIVQQALAVLFNLLTEDNRTKVNMSSVRQMALTAGIIDIIQAIEKKHGRENQGIKGLCQGILNSLITEWS